MCQMSAVLSREGQQEKIMDNVTQLEVTSEGIVLHSLFEEPRLVPAARLQKIDFLAGTLTLVAADTGG